MLHGSILLSALLTLAAVTSDEPPGPRRDLIHSDVPLWTSQREMMWPRAFYDSDSFGCQTRVRYGDWRFEEGGMDADSVWYRFHNYGVNHCFALVQESRERAELAAARPDPSFFIELGTARGRNGPVELWALQRGVRPGSEYLLLARAPAAGAIAAFDVLQRACPRDRMRGGMNLSILLTGYCAIDSREELIQLARRMARLPPLGRIALAEPISGQD